jgi:hypothetical protein
MHKSLCSVPSTEKEEEEEKKQTQKTISIYEMLHIMGNKQ